jgi:hypothetical protein
MCLYVAQQQRLLALISVKGLENKMENTKKSKPMGANDVHLSYVTSKSVNYRSPKRKRLFPISFI